MDVSPIPLPPRPGSRVLEAVRHSLKDAGPRQEAVAEELPVGFLYNHFPFAVMLATPADLEDFAVGFSLTEGIVTAGEEISQIAARPMDDGMELAITITKDRYMLLRERQRRNLMAGSSCGLCGSDSFAEALRPVDPVRSPQTFSVQAIYQAMADFPARQILNQDVGAFHAAAFVGADGQILAVREDIGRHNALDKLIGGLVRNGIERNEGFVLVSSRCSYEMVRKTAAAGVPLIASVSAPTTLAIDLANATGVGLAAFARDSRFTLYANPGRVAG